MALCFLVVMPVAAADAASGASRGVASCPLPAGSASASWAFHAGAPITGATGSYAHGNGTLSGTSASGRVCQVDRLRASEDRQIQLVARGTASLERGVTVNGVRGALLAMPLRVASTTDSRCSVGTSGKLMLFSSYNGVHLDFARFTFPKACRDHNHEYRGSGVAVSLPS